MKSLLLIAIIFFLSIGNQFACSYMSHQFISMEDIGGGEYLITFEMCQGASDGIDSYTTGLYLDFPCLTITDVLTTTLTSTNGIEISAIFSDGTIEWGDVSDTTLPHFIDGNTNGGAQQCFTVQFQATINDGCDESSMLVYEYVAAVGAWSGSEWPGDGLDHCWASGVIVIPCDGPQVDVTLNNFWASTWNSYDTYLEVLNEEGDVLTTIDYEGLATFTNISIPICIECGAYEINLVIDPEDFNANSATMTVNYNGSSETTSTGLNLSLTIETEPCCDMTVEDSYTNVSCPESCDGSINLQDFNAEGWITFSIDGGLTTHESGVFENLCLGNYSIEVADEGGCVYTNDIQIIADESLLVNLGEDIVVCDPNILFDAGNPGATYLWHDGSTNQTFTATELGEVYVTVDNGFCIRTDTLEIIIGAIAVDLGDDTFHCKGASFVLNAENDGAIYNWSTGETNQSISVSTTNDYSVTVTEGFCVATSEVNVEFYLPEAILTSDIFDGCPILDIQFTDLSTTPHGTIQNWNWNFGDGKTSDLQNPLNEYNITGEYTVTLDVIDSNNCENSNELPYKIEVYSVPEADFYYTPENPNIEEAEITFFDTSIEAVSWDWNFGDGYSSTDQNPIHEYGTGGFYVISLDVVSLHGCKNSIAWDLFIETPLTIYVPNAFSPNNDGINDLFYPIVNGLDPTEYKLEIYDRWGELVYETTDHKDKWDGGYQGVLERKTEFQYFANNGTYTWIIDVKRTDIAEKERLKGVVSILR